MKKFAAAIYSLDDYKLKLEIVEAPDNWQHALEKAFPGYVENLQEGDMEKAKEEAFNQDWLFDVKEITH